MCLESSAIWDSNASTPAVTLFDDSPRNASPDPKQAIASFESINEGLGQFLQ
jgi:hypothetical protein